LKVGGKSHNIDLATLDNALEACPLLDYLEVQCDDNISIHSRWRAAAPVNHGKGKQEPSVD
jgi:hypothetical protein